MAWGMSLAHCQSSLAGQMLQSPNRGTWKRTGRGVEQRLGAQCATWDRLVKNKKAGKVKDKERMKALCTGELCFKPTLAKERFRKDIGEAVSFKSPTPPPGKGNESPLHSELKRPA